MNKSPGPAAHAADQGGVVDAQELLGGAGRVGQGRAQVLEGLLSHAWLSSVVCAEAHLADWGWVPLPRQPAAGMGL